MTQLLTPTSPIESASTPRADARLDIKVRRAPSGGVHRRVHEEAPLRSFWPHLEAGQPPTVMLGNASGGVLGGDRLAWSVEVGADTPLLVTGQAAEKFYRAASMETASLDVALRVEDRGWLEWLPKGSIVFDGARMRRETRIEVRGSGRCLAGEVLVLGRVARGEAWRRGFVRDAWSVSLDGRLAWFDALRLDDAVDDLEDLARTPAALGGATTIATCVLVAADASRWVEPAREALEDAPDVRCGVSALPGVLVARILGAIPLAVRGAWERCVRALRAAGGWPSTLPRVATV
ncbi:MAG: urease accessory protein UreD [Dehalococcoidia bacterium]